MSIAVRLRRHELEHICLQLEAELEAEGSELTPKGAAEVQTLLARLTALYAMAYGGPGDPPIDPGKRLR